MEPNGIFPVQGLILNLLQPQQKEAFSQIGSPGPAVATNKGLITAQSTDPSANTVTSANASRSLNPGLSPNLGPNPNLSGPDRVTLVQEALLPQLSLTTVLEDIFTDNGAIQGMDRQSLISMYHKLGMDYEKRLWKALNLDGSLQGQELQEIRDTLKAQLIAAPKHDAEAKSRLGDLTNIQLKQASAYDSQAYLVMDLPYRLGDKAYQLRVAAHANKKGKVIDTEHYRIGMNTITDTLGEIGIDALFHGQSLALTIMTERPAVVSALWDQLKDSVTKHFAGKGYQLSGIRVSPLRDEHFDAFIQGIEPKGIDIEI